MKRRASCRSRKPRSSPWCDLILARSPMKTQYSLVIAALWLRGAPAYPRARQTDWFGEPGAHPCPRSCSRAQPAARPRGARPQAPREGALRPTHSLRRGNRAAAPGGARNCRTIILRGFSLGQSGCRGAAVSSTMTHRLSAARPDCDARSGCPVEGRFSDMLASCGVGPSRVNTCDYVWEEARNASKLEAGGAWPLPSVTSNEIIVQL
jgi:hypothetical protein